MKSVYLIPNSYISEYAEKVFANLKLSLADFGLTSVFYHFL